MKVLYIAGPFMGDNAWEIEQNVRAAEVISLEIARLGIVPLCPHTMYRHFEGTMPYGVWIDITMELLGHSDAILLCKGWEESSGSIGEKSVATGLGMLEFCHGADRWREDLVAWRDEPTVKAPPITPCEHARLVAEVSDPAMRERVIELEARLVCANSVWEGLSTMVSCTSPDGSVELQQVEMLLEKAGEKERG